MSTVHGSSRQHSRRGPCCRVWSDESTPGPMMIAVIGGRARVLVDAGHRERGRAIARDRHADPTSFRRGTARRFRWLQLDRRRIHHRRRCAHRGRNGDDRDRLRSARHAQDDFVVSVLSNEADDRRSTGTSSCWRQTDSHDRPRRSRRRRPRPPDRRHDLDRSLGSSMGRRLRRSPSTSPGPSSSRMSRR